MFTTQQQLWLKVAAAAAIVFFLGLIGGASFLAALIWGLLVAFVLYLLLRQNSRVAGDEDSLASALTDTVEKARSKLSESVDMVGGDADDHAETTQASANGGAADHAAVPEIEDEAPQASFEHHTEASKPNLLNSPREGGADDLKKISGVGPKLEESLHDLGVYHFDQIASWTDKELAWIDQELSAFKGRAVRDNWVEQARTLAAKG